MKPSELASRIAALDWSGLPLQHQLAVTAAVETLKQLEPPAMPNAIPNATVLPFPTTPQVRTVRILHLDGREWASAGFIGPDSAWSWIAESVAAECECNEDDVHCIEDPEGGDDIVTVDGLPLYRIAHGSRKN